jgi:hypothetical protein
MTGTGTTWKDCSMRLLDEFLRFVLMVIGCGILWLLFCFYSLWGRSDE